MTSYLRPVPRRFGDDGDTAMFLEQIRARLRDATVTSPGLVRQAAAHPESLATVGTGSAGTTYTAAEQALLNEVRECHNQLVADLNSLVAKLRSAGTIDE